MAKPKLKQCSPRTATKSKLARHSSSQVPTLTITVRDDDDFATFCENLLKRGYDAWLAAQGRAIRLQHSRSLPLYANQSWKDWRRTLAPMVRHWWEEYTGFRDPKPRRGTFYDRCNDLIGRILPSLPKDATGHPLYKRKPLTAYRLSALMYTMYEEDARLHPRQMGTALSKEVCDKYARLWRIRQICATPHRLTLADLRFLKQHDPSIHIEADPRLLLRLLRRP